MRIEFGSGILTVVPAWKLAALLNREDVRAAREAVPDDAMIEDLAGDDSVDPTADLMGKLLQVPKDEADEVHRERCP